MTTSEEVYEYEVQLRTENTGLQFLRTNILKEHIENIRNSARTSPKHVWKISFDLPDKSNPGKSIHYRCIRDNVDPNKWNVTRMDLYLDEIAEHTKAKIQGRIPEDTPEPEMKVYGTLSELLVSY